MELSVIIPAYNESKRLPTFLRDVMDYLDAEYPNLYEIILVDDGSNDETSLAVSEFLHRPYIRLLRHEVNRGKGEAVQTGVKVASGRLRLFADADGATPIQEERRLRRMIFAGADIAIGSRAAREVRGEASLVAGFQAEDKVEWEVNLHRYLIGRTFATLTKCILGLGYEDSQCGFKLFRGAVAAELFSHLTLGRFIFDVEILYLAKKLGYQVVEVPVNWRDVPGSKVHLVRDSWRMFLGLWQIRHRHGSLRRRELANAITS
jgi:dolichyl-phosphate beta-glucosyltransferase